MFLRFFEALRREGVPVSPREFLSFLEGVQAGLVSFDIEGFYHLGRASMVKDERHLDRYDRAFSSSFKGLESISNADLIKALDLPEDWLRKELEKHLTPEEMAQIQSLGGFEALIETLRKRLEEQRERHQGGSKWIGTGGTSPFGAYGYNPEGLRIGQDQSRHRRAVKVWERREFRNLDDRSEVSSRNLKLALRSLRRWAREGATEELDLPGTISATAKSGWLDVQTRPERRNAARVLLFLDVGGSMDPHIQMMEELFAAARDAFNHLEVWYFHNCLYEGVWRDNRRRHDQITPTWDLLRGHTAAWNAIFVGDAAMSPYEITHAGGANEHWNKEAGGLWLNRAVTHWPRHLWINPLPRQEWDYTQSVRLISDIFSARMVPMTPEGIAQGIRLLR